MALGSQRPTSRRPEVTSDVAVRVVFPPSAFSSRRAPLTWAQWAGRMVQRLRTREPLTCRLRRPLRASPANERPGLSATMGGVR